jgi:Pro-kumamolisin, activation domain/IPT/TIG domain
VPASISARTARRQLRVAAAALTVLGLVVASAGASAAPTPDPDVALSANVVRGLQQVGRVGDEDASKMIDVQISLKLRNRAQLDDLIRRVSTHGSPDYGKYLTPAQFGAQFGPTAAQVDKAAAFLRANGLQVTTATPGSTLVDARGTVAAVRQALHTQIGRYREASGREFFANDSAPALPSSLAVSVAGVLGLDNRSQRHHAAVQPRACPPTCAGTPYTPTQLRTGYALAAAPLTSLTGAGQTLGLLELDDYQQANINGYDTAYSLPALTPQRQVVDFGAGISNAGEIEVELDIEVMHALARGATILVFEGPNSDVGVNDTYGCMVNPNAGTNQGACPNQGSGITAPSNSTSWGLCEPGQGQGETDTLGAIFAQAAVQGQSFFAASGDTGAYDCYPTDTSNIWVDSPASDPNVTGVGGTKLLLNPDNSYNSEQAWPAEPQAIYGSGGGKSIYWSRPAWQTGPGVITSANASRQVPDVSLDADPVTGYSIYTCASSSGSCSGGSAHLRSLGGTSAGAPAWAAFAAVYNQYAACAGQPNLGFANPTLYRLNVNAQTFTPFNDITMGDNKEGTALGYSAGPNYDMVTGLGSLRAADFTQDVAGTSPAPVRINSLDHSQGVSGDTIHVFGCGFRTSGNQVPAVTFGATASSGVTFVSSSDLAAVVPAHATGSVSIAVTNPAGVGGGSASISNAFTYLPGGDGQWSAWYWLGDNVTGPAVGTNADGRLEVTGLSSDHSAWHAWQNTAGGNWSAGASLGGSLLSSPSMARNADGRLELFAEGADGSAWHKWQTSPGAGWSGWFSLGGGIVGTPTVGTDADGRLELFVLANSGSVYHAWQASQGAGWTGWYPLGGSLVSVPSAGRNVDGRLEIFARGSDGTAWHAWQNVANGGWSGWSSLGGQIAGSPSVGTNADGRLELFATTADRQSWHNWQASPGAGWFGWAPFGGSLTGAPAVARTPSGRLVVFGTNLDGNVWRQVQTNLNGAWGGWASVGGPGLVGVVAGTNTDGRLELIAQSGGGAFWHSWQLSASP